MHFTNTTACISSLLMVTASASMPASFLVPSTGSGTAAVPGAPEGDITTTTTVYETSTFYVTSAVTVPTPVASASSSSEVVSVPANSSAVTISSCSETAPPAEITPIRSLCVTGSQTFVPVTLWENGTTRVIYPQNSTALEIPTGYAANGTAPSTVVVTTSVASKTAMTTSKHTSATASPSATVSEVPTNGAGKVAGDAVLGMGLVAGFMALL
ncbi:Mucin-5B [Didymella heteroderae]|uniref:Mucin-5B n=1 Tax=Didymella heteroderae TaxID=1769908 RepID=A0A9P4WS40_9PLEO|nr:Mucin-5B [Didymella heteroderae]